MNTRSLLVSMLIFVCVLLSACAPVATGTPASTALPATVVPVATQVTNKFELMGDPVPDNLLGVEFISGKVALRFRTADDPICQELKTPGNCFTFLRTDHDPISDPGARGPAAIVDGLIAMKFQQCPFCEAREIGGVEYFQMKEDDGTLLGVKCELNTGTACNADVGSIWKPTVQPTNAPVIVEHKIPTLAAHAGGIKVGSDGSIWFVETSAQQIARISLDGVVTEYPLSEGGIAEGQGFLGVGADGALWFNEDDANKIGRITPAGEITEFDLPEGIAPIRELVTDGDGALWVTSRGGNAIVKLTSDAQIAAQYTLPMERSGPTGMIVGPDQAFWFVESGANQIGRITKDGQLTEYSLPDENSFPLRLALGPDDAVWFTMFGVNKLGRIDMNGNITTFDAPDMGPVGITSGPDGAIWFTGYSSTEIGRMTTDGVLTKFPVATYASVPYHITAGPDGSLWFTEQEGNMIGQIRLSAK